MMFGPEHVWNVREKMIKKIKPEIFAGIPKVLSNQQKVRLERAERIGRDGLEAESDEILIQY